MDESCEIETKQAGCELCVSELPTLNSTRTTPSCTRTGKVLTHSRFSAWFVTLPVTRSIFQACKGQTTVLPETIPSASGPPRCGQRFSTARKRLPKLKIASLRPPTWTDRPSRTGMFSIAVRLTQIFVSLIGTPFPRVRSARIVWNALVRRPQATRRVPGVSICEAARASLVAHPAVRTRCPVALFRS